MDAEVNLEFMTGNPQLGVLSGCLTYLRSTSSADTRSLEQNQQDDDEEEDAGDSKHATVCWDSPAPASRSDLPNSRSTLLCILSVPAHMIPTDMLQFVAPFKMQVHFVRILRPCTPVGPSDPARTPTEYMVLLQMENQVNMMWKSSCVKKRGDVVVLSCVWRGFGGNEYDLMLGALIIVKIERYTLRQCGSKRRIEPHWLLGAAEPQLLVPYSPVRTRTAVRATLITLRSHGRFSCLRATPYMLQVYYCYRFTSRDRQISTARALYLMFLNKAAILAGNLLRVLLSVYVLKK